MLRIKFLLNLFFLPLLAVQVQIEKPTYKENTVSTNSGGVITDENFRIQAQNIDYTYVKGKTNYLKASKDILLQIGDKMYLASEIEYDFLSQEGQVHELKTQKGELYHGARLTKIKNKAIIFDNAFAYTSENEAKSAKVEAKTATLTNAKNLHAENIETKINNKTLISLPKADIDVSPEKKSTAYKLSYNTKSGPVVFAHYPFMDSESIKIDAKLEYRPQTSFASIYSKGVFTNSDNSIKATQNTVITPRAPGSINSSTPLSLNARSHTKIEGSQQDLLYTLNIDKVSHKDVLTKYSSANLYKNPLEKSYFNLQSNTKNYQTNFELSKRINSFEMTREALPLFRTLSKNIALGQGIYFFHDFELSQTNLVYPSNFDPIFKPTTNSSLTSSQTVFRPVKTHYFSILPEITTIGKYNHENNSAFALVNLKTELNTKFKSQFSKHSLDLNHTQHKLYSVFEGTVSNIEKNTSLHKIIQNEQNYKIANLKFGLSSLSFNPNTSSSANRDLFFFVYKDKDNRAKLSDVFLNYELLHNKSTFSLGVQVDHDPQTYSSFDFYNLANVISTGYSYAFSKTHAFSCDTYYFGKNSIAKNQYDNFKLEAIYGHEILKKSPLCHPVINSTVKYQFSPYPLYNCKLKASAYGNENKEIAYSLGADLTTIIYTIYELNTNFSYEIKHQAKNNFGFSFSINILR